MDRDPFKQFERWLELAVNAEIPDPHAMVVATSSPDGIPSARVVLLREFDATGFVFYTNYASRKGTEALTNPKASLVFFWHEMDRQIRIEGELEKIDPVDSDSYFASRPRESQIAAWASNQSGVISGRAELQKRFQEFESRFDGRPVPRPENWGGLRLRPRTFEFWQGRPNRLHDRIAYSLTNDRWEVFRLAP